MFDVTTIIGNSLTWHLCKDPGHRPRRNNRGSTWTVVSTQLETEHRVIKIPVETIGLPNPEVQEKLQGLSHMDLVMSQMPMELL
jgi:hypothetical protein